MKLNNAGYLLICKFEGLSLIPYLCPAKIPTIGYGNCYYPNGKKVTMQDKAITKQEAFELFKFIADKFALKVSELIKSNVNQNQFNALVSFAYNIGVNALSKSTLLKKVNFNPDDLTIKNEFLKWNKAGGKEIKGLTTRREQESDLYYEKSNL
jgi:lysozyme